jgi:hypothetical protein
LLAVLGVGIRLEIASAHSGHPREETPDCPHLKLWRDRARKAGAKRYAGMNSIERAAFHRNAGIASGKARRRAAASKRRKRKPTARPVIAALT